MSRTVYATCLILALGLLASDAFAQEFTTAEVLARLDEKAKVFSSLETSVSHTQYRDGLKFPTEAGKIYIKMSKAPRFFWNVTDPREPKQFLINSGELKHHHLVRESVEGVVRAGVYHRDRDRRDLIAVE